jgi:undecaprenyl pyrophosphate synthase
VTDDEHGIPAAALIEDDLRRELKHLHETRHETFLHGSQDALDEHTRRTAELEAEFIRRHRHREIDPARLRAGRH